ncbi:hypothetical protein BO78DRAFT_420985 [Aspergillus sclerotiicarbonarius CBS 121057]|uniref:Uncharacterized protein n=1 Tax=Aspergillus sclerotiicarbonarius (strain CBS 121057 / IBT 28362) TaxID=1448318 RepID=A0A319E209_ASPSB|nr:hypothetical protein BO78DRAFT_420985 [Aspergillus sclerotiicarbonarius CBS 121057]
MASAAATCLAAEVAPALGPLILGGMVVVVVSGSTYLLVTKGFKLACAMKGLFTAKAVKATSAGCYYTAVPTATTTITTASTAAATTATATTATTATTASATTAASATTTAAATTTTATTTSTVATLTSWAITPVGIVVICGVTGYAAYYGYVSYISKYEDLALILLFRGQQKYKSWNASRDKPPETTSKTKEPHKQDQQKKSSGENDPERDPPPGIDKPVLIPKNELKKLLNSEGREMFEKLKSLLTGDRTRTVWSDKNYRIDPGHTMHGNPNLKTWNLQVQSEAKSAMAQFLKGKYGTHAKLIWDVFNMENPPSFAVWMNRLLSLYN